MVNTATIVLVMITCLVSLLFFGSLAIAITIDAVNLLSSAFLKTFPLKWYMAGALCMFVIFAGESADTKNVANVMNAIIFVGLMKGHFTRLIIALRDRPAETGYSLPN